MIRSQSGAWVLVRCSWKLVCETRDWILFSELWGETENGPLGWVINRLLWRDRGQLFRKGRRSHMLRDSEPSQVPGSYEHEWSNLRPILVAMSASAEGGCSVPTREELPLCQGVPAEWGNVRAGSRAVPHPGHRESPCFRQKHRDAVCPKQKAGTPEKKSPKTVGFVLHHSQKEKKGRLDERLLPPEVTLRNLA